MPGTESPPAAASQISAFLAKYDPAIVSIAREARTRLRRRMPAATELVYDNYNALVFGFGPSDRASEAILSLALYPRWVTLFFLRGVGLPDPERLLQGAGKQVRSIRLAAASDLDAPAIEALLAEAIRSAPVPMPTKGRGATLIKAVSAQQRPRR